MKTTDIFEEISHKSTIRKKIPQPKTKQLGTGVESDVFATKSPNKVLKIGYINDPDQDPYVKFIEMVMDHQDNPFFPRIYGAKIINAPRKKDGKVSAPHLIVSMEKLHPIQSTKLREVVPQLLSSLGMKDPSKGATADPTKTNISTKDAISWRSFIRDISTTELSELERRTKNPKFKEAIRLMTQVGADFDLHDQNFMIRLTGHGPQLVITDPFFPTQFNNM